jgi:hypothetical protein
MDASCTCVYDASERLVIEMVIYYFKECMKEKKCKA